MKFRSEYRFSESFPNISHGEGIYLSGSCFSENFTRRLEWHGFPALSNSHGIVYNPISLIGSLEDVISGKIYTTEDLTRAGDRWISYSHHGQFSQKETGAMLDEINKTIDLHRHFLRSARHLFITFGTAWTYTEISSGKVVANCHKQPAAIFDKKLLSIPDIVDKVVGFLGRLKEFNKNISVFFTISPVKHLRDGMHGNQLSKATLLLATDEIVKQTEATYFPAYELVTDDLRDYRFYEKDFAHPNTLAIDYVWERFAEVFFSSRTQAIAEEVNRFRQLEAHRPLHPEDAPKHHEKVRAARESLLQKYPYLPL